MNKKDPSVFVSHILECIKKIEEYLAGKTKEDFLNSTQLQDAVNYPALPGGACRKISLKLTTTYFKKRDPAVNRAQL